VLRALKSASNTATQNELDLISIHLKEAIEQFDWLVGKTTPDDILNTIFSRFCVGK
jgi:tRNA U34 5-carboxymethylaminomethyl modifying GTPase MnmE/TrmE